MKSRNLSKKLKRRRCWSEHLQLIFVYYIWLIKLPSSAFTVKKPFLLETCYIKMEEEFDSSFDQPQNTSIASAKGPKRRTKAQLNKTKEKIDIPNISIESNSEGEEPHDSLERITEFPLNPMIGEEYERIEEFYEQCAK